MRMMEWAHLEFLSFMFLFCNCRLIEDGLDGYGIPELWVPGFLKLDQNFG